MVTPQERDALLLDLLKGTFSSYKFVEESTMIGFPGPGATAPEISIDEIFKRYGIDAFVEIVEYGTFVKPKEEEVPTETSTDCRTNTGVTVGLIDGMIAICRVLRHSDISDPAVVAALADLRDDEDLAWLLSE